MPLPTAEQAKSRSPHFPNRTSSRKAVNSNFKVIRLTRLGIRPESTAPEADALTTRPSELSNNDRYMQVNKV